VQDPQVLLGRPLRLPLHQQVIGQAEAAAGEQVGPVAVVGKGPRLAQQPVDDMAVVDAVLAPTPQPRQLLDPLLGVPDLDLFRVQPRLHPLADQPAGHRVDVARHPDEAAALHPHPQPLTRLQATLRQGPQHRHLFRQTRLTASVALPEHLPQEGPVGVAAGKVAAAAEHQGLVQGAFALMMALLHVPVLMGLPCVDGLAPQPVVPQQGLITPLEHARVRLGLHRRRQPVGAVDLGHASQFPEGVLKSLTETLQTLRKADRARLPVRVGQHEVIDQMRERRAGDGHPQLGAVGEITGRQPARFVDLGEEDFLGRAGLGPPALEPPLQGPQLALGEATRKTALQIGQQGLGLQAGVEPQQLFELRPDLGEGIGSGTPVPVHELDLAGQLAEPTVLARRFGIEAGLGGRLLLG
jgi:hypothetical protein